jgi:hypothetical protein
MTFINNLKTKYLPKDFFVSTSNFFQPIFDCYLANSKSEYIIAHILRYKIYFNERTVQKIFN